MGDGCWVRHPKCVSSFTYKGQMYENCTSAGHKQPWCATHEDYKFWGWQNCIKASCESWMTPVTTTLEAGLFGKAPPGTRPALCEADSNHPDKIDDWCFAACPKGYEAHGSKCWTSCSGDF